MNAPAAPRGIMKTGNVRGVARKGAVIVEFALVVPFIALIVFGVIDLSRAYGQMNALNSALREGARFGSRVADFSTGDPATLIKGKVQQYATTYGFSGLDVSKINVSTTNNSAGWVEYVTVAAAAHPIPLPILGSFLGVPALTVTRSASYRWECAGLAVCPP
jgi:Flp pilus assembly protein TadG